MARTITAGEALGHRLMRASCKEQVIHYLGSSDVPAPQRRRWYREWCRATLSKCHAADLDRVAPPAKSRERELPLPLEGSSGPGAPQLNADRQHVDSVDQTRRAASAGKTAAADDAVTASGPGE